MTMEHPKAPTKDEAKAATWVLWDINRCPVPSEVDARRVVPCIRRALKNLGYNGPLNITAIGILTEVPRDVLQDLCSTGIALKHVPTDMSSIADHLCCWRLTNSPPVNFMFISVEPNFGHYLASYESHGYNILWSLFPYDIESSSSSPKILVGWKSLAPKLREEAQVENCGETGKSSLLCSTCKADKFGIESFIKHLYSKEHALQLFCFFLQKFDPQWFLFHWMFILLSSQELQFYPDAIEVSFYCDFHQEDATSIQTVLETLREALRRREREEEEDREKEKYKRQRIDRSRT